MSGGDDEGEFEDAQLLHPPWPICVNSLDCFSNLLQLNEFKIVVAVIGWIK